MFSIVLSLGFLSIVAPRAVALADNGTAICSAQTDASKNIGVCINRIYVISLAAGGTIAVLIFVIAGYLYMSGGNNAGEAKKMILSAITGLVILFSAFLFLNTINPDLTSFTGLSLANLTCGSGNTICTAPSSSFGGTDTSGTGTTPTPTTGTGGTLIIDGYNLTSYSTSASFGSTITSVLQSTQAAKLSGAQAITAYMANKVNAGPKPGPTPITGDMVVNSATNYGVDPNMLLTIMWVESGFGTTSATDIKTHNPGSVGNTDNGSTVDDGTWQDGVDALAQWLSNHESN
jgi:hypothetical protein